MEAQGANALQVVVAREDSSTTLTLQGDLDLAAEPIMAQAIDRLRPLTTALVIDLGDVEFVDSTGLRSLLSVRDAALADTGSVPSLTRCSAGTRRVLELSGLLDAFAIDG